MYTGSKIFDDLLEVESPRPKFERIVDAMREAVRSGRLGIGDSLPSINLMSSRYGLARETVRKSYEILRRQGLITSRRGKGYSIASRRTETQLNVFLFFDALANAYKETLYEAIRQRAGSKVNFDCYAHHFQSQQFVNLLREARGKYHYYVVIPTRDPVSCRALAEMEQEKLLILDNDVRVPGVTCLRVVQNHDERLIDALESGLDRLRRYRRFVLVFPTDRHHPTVIKRAFTRFCRQHGFRSQIIPRITPQNVEAGLAYLIIEDNDLVALVKTSWAKKFQLGRDLGVISYNETRLKEIVAGGVTVVSVDFHELGVRAAETILGLNRQSIQLPTQFIRRATL